MTEEKNDVTAAVPGCLRGKNIEPVGATLLSRETLNILFCV